MSKSGQTRTLSFDAARWICPPEALGFTTTAELSPEDRILGQQDAVDALSFGLENRLKSNNVFVRGLSGFGRMGLIHQMIEETALTPSRSPDPAQLAPGHWGSILQNHG
jgi:hypothetical protein